MSAAVAWVLGAIFTGYAGFVGWWAARDPEAREMARLDGWTRPWQFAGLIWLALAVAWVVIVALVGLVAGEIGQ